MTAATSAQPGAGQDDYNPFADEGVKEKEPEVNDNIVICTFLCSWDYLVTGFGARYSLLRKCPHFTGRFIHFRV